MRLSPLPLAPFPVLWFFNMKRQNFLLGPRNGACILNRHQLPSLFACGFVSFHTSLKPPLSVQNRLYPVVRREEGRAGTRESVTRFLSKL